MKKPTLEHLRENALRNMRRQRRKEEMGYVTRVSSNFWEQVADDYLMAIAKGNDYNGPTKTGRALDEKAAMVHVQKIMSKLNSKKK